MYFQCCCQVCGSFNHCSFFNFCYRTFYLTSNEPVFIWCFGVLKRHNWSLSWQICFPMLYGIFFICHFTCKLALQFVLKMSKRKKNFIIRGCLCISIFIHVFYSYAFLFMVEPRTVFIWCTMDKNQWISQ